MSSEISPNHIDQPTSRFSRLSLFSVLGGAILIAFSLIIGISLWGQYSLSNQIISKEINNSVQQNHALLRVVLKTQLTLTSYQLQALSTHKELTTLNDNNTLADINRPLQQILTNQDQVINSDFIVLSSPDSRTCSNAHLPFETVTIDCKTLIQQFDSSLYDWHLVNLDNLDPLPLIMIQTRLPIVTKSGKVLAYLHGGTFLTGNVSVISRAVQLAPEQTLAAGISYDGQLITTTAKPESTEYKALQQATLQPQQLITELPGDMVAMSQPIELEFLQEHDVRLVSVVRTDGIYQLQQGIILQSTKILLLAIILAVVIVLLTLQLALSPLDRLRDFAAQRRSSTLQQFTPGPIVEFQQLSNEIALMLTELQTTEQRLREKSRLLEHSHQEQTALANRNRRLIHQLFKLQEQERKYLAQELHDELGQPLAVINTDAYLIKSGSDSDSKIHQYALSIQQNTAEMSDVVYQRIKSLRPMPLNDLGLIEAIRHMPALDNFSTHGINIELSLPQTLPSLSEQVEIHLFRIVQEGLTNILKHSRASQAWLQLRLLPPTSLSGDSHDPRLQLKIADNGIGFSEENIDRQERFGLNGMIERLSSMNGTLVLEDTQGKGSSILIEIELGTENHNPENLSQ
ncbi:MAG: ATP-binding protein [Motiliproteus sp.]